MRFKKLSEKLFKGCGCEERAAQNRSGLVVREDSSSALTKQTRLWAAFQKASKPAVKLLSIFSTGLCALTLTSTLPIYADDMAPTPSGYQPSLQIANRYAEPLNAAASDLPIPSSAQAGGLRTIASPPLPPVSVFPADKQNTTFLTRFILNYNRRLSWEAADMMAQAILGVSKSLNMDFRLVAGVLAVESSFRTDAVSSSGAIGLGQLKPATAQWLGVSNPFDPLENIAGATRYLRFLLTRYNGNLDNAVSAYFQGQGTIDRFGITNECKPYLAKINTVLARF